MAVVVLLSLGALPFGRAWAADCAADNVECVEPTFGPWTYHWSEFYPLETLNICGTVIPNQFTTVAAAAGALVQEETCGNTPERTVSVTYRDLWAPPFAYPGPGYYDWLYYGVPDPYRLGHGSRDWVVSQVGGQLIGTESALPLQSLTTTTNGTTTTSYGMLSNRLQAERVPICPNGYNLGADTRMGISICQKVSYSDYEIAKKDRNVGECCLQVGNPINPGTGSKVETALDGSTGTSFPIELKRIYDSQYQPSVNFHSWPREGIGHRWKWMFASSLKVGFNGTGNGSDRSAIVTRPDGKRSRFEHFDGTWVPLPGVSDALEEETDLTGATTGWSYRPSASRIVEYYSADGRLERIADGEGHLHYYSYDADGRLESISDQNGRFVAFEYMALVGGQQVPEGSPRPLGDALTDQVRLITDSSGRVWTYEYDLTSQTLSSVTYPDGAKTLYHYEDARDNQLLTGISNVSADGIVARYATYAYDASGRATQTTHSDGADSYSLEYLPGNKARVTRVIDPVLGTSQSSTYSFATVSGRRLPSALSALCLGCSSEKSITYDEQGFRNLVTDFANVVTDYDYDSQGNLLQVIRAKGTAVQQVKTWQWNAALRVPTQIDVPGRHEARTYNARGQLLTSTVTDTTVTPNASRTSTSVYCEDPDVAAGTCPLAGLLMRWDGPRADVSDVTAYTYYPSDEPACAGSPYTCRYRQGDLWKSTNALGQVVEYLAYDGSGRVLSIKDSNGVVTDFEYAPRGWLTARKVRGSDPLVEVDDAITRMEYDTRGSLTKVVQPDGTYTNFTYDGNRRLTGITDALGSRLHFGLDAAGNRTTESTYDSTGAVRRNLSRIFNDIGQMRSLLDANAAGTTFTYDVNGYGDTGTDALGRTTDSDLDPLGRLSQEIVNVGGGVNERAVTRFRYDARDNLTAVVDPKGLETLYDHNGFDELVRLSSPDTGVSTFGYDLAGNRTSQIDARGKPLGFSYDALNRLTSQSVPTAAQNVFFDYDVTPADCPPGERYGVGRVTQIRDESGSARYCYDSRGRRVRQVQAVTGGSTLSVGATFNGSDRLVAMTYPSGAVVAYWRDDSGQIARIDAQTVPGGTQHVLVANATYLPFGPLASLTFGNGRVLTKTYDQNYRIDSVSDSASGNPLSLDYSLNSVGAVSKIVERKSSLSVVSRDYRTDGLDRLVAQYDGSIEVEAFGYDASGNRTSKTENGVSTSYDYETASHRLIGEGSTARSYDPSGNVVLIGRANKGRAFAYDDRNRLRDFRVGNKLKATYRYNGRGERVLKLDNSAPANSRQYVYDEAGRLLGEYTVAGVAVKEYVWLDDVLVAIMSNFDGSSYQFVETDHLGTPRAVIHPSKNEIAWRWDATPFSFGAHLPNGNPDSDSQTYTLNLRYPGQYYDAESGLFHNGIRDYEPETGRYLQSDPIGLSGGMSTYGYSLQSPLTAIDPTGLEARLVDIPPTNQRPAGSIYCVDGVIRPFFMWSQWPPDYSQCQQVRDCVYAHEMSHVADANRSNPALCQKSPLHWLLGTSPKVVTFSAHVDPASGLSELDISELYAHAAELRCLSAKLKAAQCDPRCKATVVRRIRQIINESLPAIYGGVYGSE